MRGINFLAGLGTIFIFIGIYCFKALFQKKMPREEMEKVNYTPIKNSEKALLIFLGCVCVVLGLGLILKSLKVI
jgi:hypothetical protein